MCGTAALGCESFTFCSTAEGGCATQAKIILFLIAMAVLFFSSPTASHAATQRFPPPDFGPNFIYPHSYEGQPRAGWLAWLDMAALVIALPLAAVITLKRRNRRAMVILSLFSVAYFGFYREGCVCPIGAIQNVSQALFDRSFIVPIVVLVFFALPLLAALLVGRVFCSGVCPLGALQDLVLIKPLKVPRWLDRTLGTIPFLYLGLAVLLAAIGSSYIICKYDPYVAFFRMAGNFHVWIWSAMMVAVALFIGRPYCRYLCPYGALLGLLSRFSFRRTSITPDKCIACGLCRDACAFSAIREGGAKGDEEEEDFEQAAASIRISRPLLTIAALALLGALFGHLAAPALSHDHYIVQVAERIWLEESQDIKSRTDQSTAFRNTGIPTAQLYADAQAIQRKFRVGGTLFGLWCGLVIAFTTVRLRAERRHHDYIPDPARCISCARCYKACPIERQRLKEGMQIIG